MSRQDNPPSARSSLPATLPGQEEGSRPIFGYIYVTKNLANGKMYIGQHIGSLRRSYLGSGMILKLAIEKYGKQKFLMRPIKWVRTQKDLDYFEEYFRLLYITRFGQRMIYNIRCGGARGQHSESTKNKIRVANKGQNLGGTLSLETRNKIGAAHKGRKLSKEVRRRISIGHLGIPPWNKGRHTGQVCWLKGKHHSTQTRTKLSAAAKRRLPPMLGKHHTLQTRMKISFRNTGQIPWIKGRHHTNSACRKVAASWKDPIIRARKILSMQEAWKERRKTSVQRTNDLV